MKKTKRFELRFSSRLAAWFIACLTLMLTSSSVAQQIDSVLYDARVGLNRLTSQSLSGETTFMVDDSCDVFVQIVSNVADLATHIEINAPGGQIVTPSNVNALGGVYRDSQVTGTTSGLCLLLPTACETGFHYVYTFPSQGAGNYTIHFTAPVGMGGLTEGAVITKFSTTSPVSRLACWPEDCGGHHQSQQLDRGVGADGRQPVRRPHTR